MPTTVLPDMHYITERDRAQVHPAVVRCISIPSVPANFPFKAPISDERRYRGPRFTIGWMEFQSPEQPDPEVARPGDVWIQLPSGHRKARVYACYNIDGKDWSPWAGNSVILGGRGNTPMHPFLNDHAQRKFFLVFNGSEFTWANPKAVSVIMHANPQIYTMGPAEAVIKWLKVTGVGRTSPAPVEKVLRSTSAPAANRKHARPEHSEPPGDSASVPPPKKSKPSPSHHPASTTPAPDRPLAVKLGAYAKAGATQQGWIMSIDGMPLHMPFPCINCTRSKTPCSGIPGERCGRCRFKRLGCSHHAQKPRAQSAAPVTEVPTATVESSPTSQSGLTLRVPPLLRPWVPGSATDAAQPKDANKTPGQRSPKRVRIRSASVAARSENGEIRSSSPLSSAHELTYPAPPHSESAILDARDDAAVENLLDSASMAVSAVSAPAPDAEGAGEPAAQSNTADKTPVQGVAGGMEEEEEEEEDEDDEFARFVQMTLDGIARAQEGLRGVFALTRRNLKAKRIAATAQKVTAATAAAAVASGVPNGESSAVSATH
ncbi:hypothetical protein EI94DRAFT_1743769 [Lactarius quietus]|nr:hypothetical protein EI94DRAFT_1743769 [Lactarius quietus]